MVGQITIHDKQGYHVEIDAQFYSGQPKIYYHPTEDLIDEARSRNTLGGSCGVHIGVEGECIFWYGMWFANQSRMGGWASSP